MIWNIEVQSISNARTVKTTFGVFNGKGLNRIPQTRANLYN